MVQNVRRIVLGPSVGKITMIIVSFRVGTSKNKNVSTHVIFTYVKSSTGSRFLYFDLNSKMIVRNIILTQVRMKQKLLCD